MSTTQVFGMTGAKIAIGKRALQFEDSADSFAACGHPAHAEGARLQADRLWSAAFDHINPEGAWLDRRLGR
jgi:hypothetical protein